MKLDGKTVVVTGGAGGVGRALAAARLILRAIEKEKFRVFLGFDSKILNVVYKFAPRAAMNLIARALK